MQSYMWILRGSSWNQNYFFLKKELQLVSCPGKSLQWNSQGHSWHMQAEQFQIISLHHKKLWENVHFSLLCYKSRKKKWRHCDHCKEQRVSTAAESSWGGKYAWTPGKISRGKWPKSEGFCPPQPPPLLCTDPNSGQWMMTAVILEISLLPVFNPSCHKGCCYITAPWLLISPN